MQSRYSKKSRRARGGAKKRKSHRRRSHKRHSVRREMAPPVAAQQPPEQFRGPGLMEYGKAGFGLGLGNIAANQVAEGVGNMFDGE